MLDEDGICHSIGVILDGISSDKGTSERGARYNSALRYVESREMKCVAIIISEDGMIDLHPLLLPRIRKDEIEENLEKLIKLHNEDVLDNDEYRPIMNWLEDHEFYLSQEQCGEINRIKKDCNEKEKKDPYQIFISYRDLKSTPQMNESCFLN